MPTPDLAPGPLVDEYLRRHMIPDPESAAELVAPDMQIRFTGNRPMKHPAEATAFNAGRYAWVKKSRIMIMAPTSSTAALRPQPTTPPNVARQAGRHAPWRMYSANRMPAP